MTALMILRYPLSSWYLLEKNSDMVMELPDTTECFLKRLATKSQHRYEPMARPIPIHTSPIPATTIAPGSPMSSQPLISDACADIAVTYGLFFLPPRKYSLIPWFLVLLRNHIPRSSIATK